MARGKKLGDTEGQLVGINMFIFIIFHITRCALNIELKTVRSRVLHLTSLRRA